MEERCSKFIEKVKKNGSNDNGKWAYACILRFLQHQKNRYDKREITGSTVRGYYKAVKLFAEVNDILLPWSKLKRGLQRGRHYADDRIPTLEEIRKLVEYPDRRIKAIVYTMASSGIRLGERVTLTTIPLIFLAIASRIKAEPLLDGFDYLTAVGSRRPKRVISFVNSLRLNMKSTISTVGRILAGRISKW
jgi:integrase